MLGETAVSCCGLPVNEGVGFGRRPPMRSQASSGLCLRFYISDSGDDKNDGLSLKTAIYSFKRAKELCGGRNDFSWHFGPRAWKRIQKELADKKRRTLKR